MPRHKWDPVCPEPKGLVRPVRIDPAGVTGPTRGQAAGRGWRRTSQGFHVPAGTPVNVPEQRILEQSVRLPAGGAVTGWAACRLHRVGLLDGLAPDGVTRIPVPLVIGPDSRIRGDAGIVRLRERLERDDITSRYGIPCTTVERAAFDAMRLAADEREATVVPSMVTAAGRSSLVRLRAYVDRHPGWRNVGQARRALQLATEHFRSPNEVRAYLIWVLDAGLPRPWPNVEVRDLQGRLLGVADLLDDEAGLAVEFDGEDHRSKDQHTRDVRKEDAFRRVGIEVVRVTGTDLHDRPLVVDRLLAGRARARFEPHEVRRWRARRPVDHVEQELLEREVSRELAALVESQPLPDIDELRAM
jgi:hypothetical protein